jgi:hypothetical protein
MRLTPALMAVSESILKGNASDVFDTWQPPHSSLLAKVAAAAVPAAVPVAETEAEGGAAAG